MDLGCIDMGCLEKKPNENKASKDVAQSSMGALNKLSSQIKKPSHRKGSPINWFPRKKVDSFLKRKIKRLQEVGGMNLTLDETLGDSNPHYSKVLKEKMAVREAAQKAMETRKAAMVEASWCRILQAARIHSKEAEALLLEAEKTAYEAFEAAKAIGVIMYDIPDFLQKQHAIENSSVNVGRLSNFNVTASFETAFEVDKQVGAALKTAFIKLASCRSINKEEFKELLRKISETPDTELSSECESDTGSEFESGLNCKVVITEFKTRNVKKKQVLEKFNTTKLVDLMLERLKHLHEDELASLATIVATCGLSAVLEAENLTDNNNSSSVVHNHPRRVSSFGVFRGKDVKQELPSLDKFLVKHMTRLEREVQKARDARMKENLDNKISLKGNNSSSVECASDLGSVLVKHSSKLEREIEEVKNTGVNPYEMNGEKLVRMQSSRRVTPEVTDVPLGKFLVKHMSKLEREVQEAKNIKPVDKENIDLNKKELEQDGKISGFKIEKNDNEEIEVCSLEEILVKPVHRLDRGKAQAPSSEDEYAPNYNQYSRKEASIEEYESLDKVLVKHVSRLEKEKKEMCSEEPLVKVKRKELGNDGDQSLDQILVKHKSRLEREKLAFAEKKDDKAENVMSRQEVRERESQEAWGGINLGKNCDEGNLDQVWVKHVSRLEKEKKEMCSEEPLVKVKRKELGNDGGQSLDQILVKHKSRLEREKLAFAEKKDDKAENVMSRQEVRERESQEAWGGINLGKNYDEGNLDQVWVKHKTRLEKEKVAFLEKPDDDQAKHTMSRREVRDRELQEAWGGLSLGNSIRPHLSKLQRDKAAWLKAEEEERRRDMEEVEVI